MSELLVEIYCEEIPSRMQKIASEHFTRLFVDFCERQEISLEEGSFSAFVTPRRLSFCAANLPEFKVNPATIKTGPKIDANEKAINGFLRANNLQSVKDLKVTEKNGAKCYCVHLPEEKICVSVLLAKELPNLLQKMAGLWPKSMEIANLKNKYRWVRPIQNILAIFSGKILNFEFSGFVANNKTYGHLLCGKKEIKVTDFASYQENLAKSNVVLDQNSRRQIICQELEKIDKKLIKSNEKLIDEIAGLVEYPQVLIGHIDDEFKNLPEPILQLTIKNHQKAILHKDRFIFVSNVAVTKKNEAKIITDNEKVVRARLKDISFYIEEDLKVPLADRLEDLKNITFHKNLGSIYQKTRRLNNLEKMISVWVPNANLVLSRNIADFAKNDLTTKAVGELPDLQGFIGSYYLKQQKNLLDEIGGEKLKAMEKAVLEQYLPTSKDSPLPKTPMGIVLAIADKIDNICALFLAGEKPTSSKDPYALRRSALGIIKILFEHKIALALGLVIGRSLNNFSIKEIAKIYPQKSKQEIKELKLRTFDEIINFFIERNKSYLREEFDVRPDIARQVFAEFLCVKKRKKYDLLSLSKRAFFIDRFARDKKNAEILLLYKRAANIVNIANKDDDKKHDAKLSMFLLKSKYEKLLYKKVKNNERLVNKLVKAQQFEAVFEILAEFEGPVKAFFDNIEVNCDDKILRHRRLSLLNKVKALFEKVINFSQIEIK